MNQEAAAAKAEAKAAKARAKALRPWWRKKRVLIPVALATWVVLGLAVGGGNDDADETTAPAAPAGVQGAASEIADVVPGECSSNAGMGQLALTVTNHSSKRSDYSVDVVFLDAAGTQVGDGLAFVQNVEPGASARDEATGFLADGASVAECKVVKVDRTASL